MLTRCGQVGIILVVVFGQFGHRLVSVIGYIGASLICRIA
ncbi:hypothetical protein B4065_2698 [Caldibacillus thermoamylovorans]|nr:hypothetical protein B4065_2698 [Caldibacillus thermoamylovorans]